MKKQTRRDFLARSSIGSLCMMAGIPFIDVAEEKNAIENDTYLLSRKIPVDDTYDLVVAGGGPAGTAAAVCAARLGIKVLLVEATGCLGGTGTAGLVTAFTNMANGKEMIVSGLMKEIIETLNKLKNYEKTNKKGFSCMFQYWNIGNHGRWEDFHRSVTVCG